MWKLRRPLRARKRTVPVAKNSSDILGHMSDGIGVFGGTFDPPHLGHLILAEEAQAQLKLRRLLWVLTASPPHKDDNEVTAASQRFEMVRLAIQGNPAFELSTVDMDRPGPQFTADTLKLVHVAHPGERIALIIGGDSLRELPTWHNPADVLEEADELAIMRRPGNEIDLTELERELPGITLKVRFVDAPLLEVASHEIRERARSGRPFRYYVPSAVFDYINKHSLYRPS
jgi:nicotinate-nucleotide adenylyltransferase